MAEAFTNLRVLREELQVLISHLHQELDSQKQTIALLRKDMVSLDFTYYIGPGIYKYRAQDVHVFTGARNEPPEATAEAGERSSLGLSQGASHSGTSSHTTHYVADVCAKSKKKIQ